MSITPNDQGGHDPAVPKVNYVVAAWTGPRRNDPHPDGSFYLRSHLAVLARLQHQLTRITVMVPNYESEPPETLSWVDSLNGSELGGARVVVQRRENVGLSYGSFAAAYEQSRDKFDFYIFVEDDYAFVRNGFDRTLIGLFESTADCGYLCGLTQIWEGKPFAGISNGLTSDDVLAKVYRKHGEIPFGPQPADRYHSAAQITFTASISDLGYRIADITDRFRSPYLDSRDLKVRDFAPQHDEYLIVPTQMIVSRSEFRGDVDWRGVLSRFDTEPL